MTSSVRYKNWSRDSVPDSKLYYMFTMLLLLVLGLMVKASYGVEDAYGSAENLLAETNPLTDETSEIPRIQAAQTCLGIREEAIRMKNQAIKTEKNALGLYSSAAHAFRAALEHEQRQNNEVEPCQARPV